MEDSISNRIKDEIGRRAVSTAVDDLIEYVTDIHSDENIPVKFTVKKSPAVRYHEYNLEIKLCASERSYLKKNIEGIVDTDKLYRYRLLKNAVYLGGESHRIMIISTDDVEYKSILFIEENDKDPYLTKIATYNTPKFEIEGEYNLMYGIRLGPNVARMSKKIRESLAESEYDTIYELKNTEESAKILLSQEL